VRLAFVTPRYGAELVGGAEAQMREAAHGLAARGHAVEVLTTCATDAGTWACAVPAGTEQDGGVTVRRFETVLNPDTARRDELDHRLLAGGPLTGEEELAWIDARFEAPALVAHLASAAKGYDAVVYSPYLFWTTLRCLPIAPDRSVLVPCLHDEPAARLRSVRAALAGAAEVWFLSEPEHQLAHRLVTLGRHRVVGSGVPVPEGHDREGFRRRHGIARPFALFAGRREDGKGWGQAVAGFAAAAAGRSTLDLALVTIGSGDVRVPRGLEGRLVDLGFLPAAEVPDAFAAASMFLQPSPNESFSRTVMEAWLAGTPVVAAAAGEVVAWHCERSGGGLLYGDELELAGCLRALAEDPGSAEALGARGRRYALEHGTWPAVLDRMEEALAAFGGTPGRTLAPAEALQVEVRAHAAATRRRLLGGGGVPLEEWVPAPGTGAAARPGARMAATAVRRAGAVARRATARWPAARRAAGAVRAARRAAGAVRAARAAWSAGGPVAPPRDTG
jgi:glycosyltransferase involved in cell wall biosynthesis